MSPASELVQRLLELLESSATRYVFGRNYEGYPETLTGDLDVCVHPGDYLGICQKFEASIRASDWGIFRRIARPYVTTYQLYLEDGMLTGQRWLLVVEFFCGYSWLGLDYYDFDAVWERRKRWRNLWAADELDGALTTLLHYFFWSGFVPEKYRKLAEIAARAGTEEVRSRLQESFDLRCANLLEELILQLLVVPPAAWENRKNFFEKLFFISPALRKQCQRELIGKRLWQNPWRICRRVAKLGFVLTADLLRLPGTVLFISHSDSQALALEVLREAKAYHLYKNRFSRVVQQPSRWKELLAVWWTLARGGLVLLPKRETQAATCVSVLIPGKRTFIAGFDRRPSDARQSWRGTPLDVRGALSPEAILCSLVRQDQR